MEPSSQQSNWLRIALSVTATNRILVCRLAVRSRGRRRPTCSGFERLRRQRCSPCGRDGGAHDLAVIVGPRLVFLFRVEPEHRRRERLTIDGGQAVPCFPPRYHGSRRSAPRLQSLTAGVWGQEASNPTPIRSQTTEAARQGQPTRSQAH